MDIKDGYFAILYDGSEYEAVSITADKNGNYKLRSTNPDDQNNGFRRYSDKIDNVFTKRVNKSEIEKIEHITPYAIFKNDPAKNKFDIIEKNDGINYAGKLILVTNNHVLAKKFGFVPSDYDARDPKRFEKIVSENEVIIDYNIEKIFFNTPKAAHHLNTKEALKPIDMTVPIHRLQEQALTKHDQIALAF